MEKKGSIITCDRCGWQTFGETVTESGVGVSRFPDGWEKRSRVIGVGYMDLCPSCVSELEALTKKWWKRKAKAEVAR